MKREIRYSPGLEIRAGEDGKEKIRGYAAVFNSLSQDLGGFREKIAPGAFADSLNNDVRALIDHDPARILGRSKAGTLRMKEDEHGLAVEIDPPDTTTGRDVVASIKRGDLSEMSFGFRTITDSWSKENGVQLRELRKVDLFDVSVVAFPAYQETSVSVRALFPEGVPEVIEEHTKEPPVTRQMPDMEAKMVEMQQKMAAMQTQMDEMKAQCDQMEEALDAANGKADESEMKASAAIKDLETAKVALENERKAGLEARASFAAEKDTHAAAIKRAIVDVEQTINLCVSVGEQIARRSIESNKRIAEMQSLLVAVQGIASAFEHELTEERAAYGETGEALWMTHSREEIDKAVAMCNSVKAEIGRRARSSCGRIAHIEAQLAATQEIAKAFEANIAEERKAAETNDASAKIEEARKHGSAVKDELGRRERLWSMNA